MRALSRVVGSRPSTGTFELPPFVRDLVWRSTEWDEESRVDLEYCSYGSVDVGPAADVAHRADGKTPTKRVEHLLLKPDGHEPSGFTQLAKDLDAAGRRVSE